MIDDDMYGYLFMNEALQKNPSLYRLKKKEEKRKVNRLRISRFYNKYSMSME